jgi:hypothetical protein
MAEQDPGDPMQSAAIVPFWIVSLSSVDDTFSLEVCVYLVPIPDPNAEVPLHVAVIFPPVTLTISIVDIDIP